MTSQISERVQRLYRESNEAVRPGRFDEARARRHFGDYVSFVLEQVSAPGRLLDVGCGSGWSSRFFAEAGLEVVGLDMNESAFEAPRHDRLSFRAGDALRLPFPDASFDVVCSYQALEHIPDPENALGEIDRVLRPGGTVCIVGPNLISVLHALKGVTVYVWKQRPLGNIFRRVEGMPRHPNGNTLLEALTAVGKNTYWLLSKLASDKATFLMREPDEQPPFHSDNDACYRCNPLDLDRYFVGRGYETLRLGRPGRPAWTAPVAGGTWFAARKTR